MQSLSLLVGGLAIGIGCFGMVLPLLPGMPFFILGSPIIGQHNRHFHPASVAGKQFLKRWAAHERPWLARTSHWPPLAQRDTSRRLRHLLWWWQGHQRVIVRRVYGAV